MAPFHDAALSRCPPPGRFGSSDAQALRFPLAEISRSMLEAVEPRVRQRSSTVPDAARPYARMSRGCWTSSSRRAHHDQALSCAASHAVAVEGSRNDTGEAPIRRARRHAHRSECRKRQHTPLRRPARARSRRMQRRPERSRSSFADVAGVERLATVAIAVAACPLLPAAAMQFSGLIDAASSASMRHAACRPSISLRRVRMFHSVDGVGELWL